MAKTLKEVLESFDFNRAALAKQRLANLRRSGRKVRGARIANLMRMAGLKEEELDDEDLDQLDEVLAADASASDWIHDFVHSTNPKFEGKTKKDRIKMALGAYYHTKNKKDGTGINEACDKCEKEELHPNQKKLDKNKNGKLDAQDFKMLRKEDVEELDERNKANATMRKNMDASRGARYKYSGNPVPDPDSKKHSSTNAYNKAIGRAVRKMDEDVEELDERRGGGPSPKGSDYPTRNAQGDPLARNMGPSKIRADKTASASDKSWADWATKKNIKDRLSKPKTKPNLPEEVEHIDEISKTTLVSYIDKAADDVVKHGMKAGQASGQGDFSKFSKPYLKAGKRTANITRAAVKLARKKTYEETEMEENQISFAEFLQLNEMEFVNGRYVHKGTYGTAKGAKYGNTDYERDTLDTKDDEGDSEPKRGRGRPKGAGSGARENLGKSKLHQSK